MVAIAMKENPGPHKHADRVPQVGKQILDEGNAQLGMVMFAGLPE